MLLMTRLLNVARLAYIPVCGIYRPFYIRITPRCTIHQPFDQVVVSS